MTVLVWQILGVVLLDRDWGLLYMDAGFSASLFLWDLTHCFV